uniref:Hypothetical lipoprotein transmembrane n=1 Tax=Spiroplasma citri TaxID=2133 RepID=Q14M54_SPICI|nr:hypothetical lipoprotein transmembrane [Spiroplasma citri]
MKKWLSFLGAITLLGTSTTSLVACNIPQYNEDELQQIKKENQINTNFQEIKENLEWICPQEKPFNQADNKYYFVVWRGKENEEWKISKFQNNINVNSLTNTIDNIKNEYHLNLGSYLGIRKITLFVYKHGFTGFAELWENNNLIKAVYRWDGDEQKLPDLIVDNNGNVKVNGE